MCSAVEPVVIGHQTGQKPGFAPVERSRFKRQLVEHRSRVGGADDAHRRLVSQVGPHRYTGEAVSHRVVHAFVLADMGVEVERPCTEPVPRMADSRMLQIRHQFRQARVQPAAHGVEIISHGTGETAKQYARTVRRAAQSIDVVVVVVERSRPGQNSVQHLGLERLGRDNEPPEGHDAALEPRHLAAGVAVGRHQHIACIHVPAWGVNAKSGSVARHAGHRCGGVYDDSRLLRPLQQPKLISARVEPTQIGDQRAAAIDIRADLGVLLAARDERRLVCKVLLAQLYLFAHGLVVGGAECAHEAAALGEVAGDVLLLDEIGDVIVGRLHLLVDRDRALGPVSLEQSAESVLEGLSHIAEIAGTRPVARHVLLEDHGFPAGPCQRQGGRKARIAGTDHRDVDALRQSRFVHAGEPEDCLMNLNRCPVCRALAERFYEEGAAVVIGDVL